MCKPVDALQSRFLAILPRIRTHARIHFDDSCPGKREDRIADTIALAWRWFQRLAAQGKDAGEFPSVLADYAVRAVKNGRRVTGMLPTKDAMSERAQRMQGFTVSKLPDFSTLAGNPLEEALRDNMQSEVPDQVAFRLDFPAWLVTRSRRDRRIICDMSMNERTLDVSRKYRISPARVSQLRRHFKEDWDRFCAA